MADYTMAVGTHDPEGFAASDDHEAIRLAAATLARRYGADLESNPQEVVTLMGPGGLVTRPGERFDEFLQRVTGINPAGDPQTVQPGDLNTPDCNGD